jgi:hypothetical protein
MTANAQVTGKGWKGLPWGGIAWGVAVIVGLGVNAGWLLGGSRPAAPMPHVETFEDRAFSAKVTCKNLVLKQLHDPDSAEFEPLSDYPLSVRANDLFQVQVLLRAKNGFGAYRKTVVECDLRHRPDGWGVESVSEVR